VVVMGDCGALRVVIQHPPPCERVLTMNDHFLPRRSS
jgi:hypothetical protein